MKSYVFRIVVEQDRFVDGRDAWHAFCPALKGCHTWGRTNKDALSNAGKAIELYVQDLLACGDKIPLENGTIELAGAAIAINV